MPYDHHEQKSCHLTARRHASQSREVVAIYKEPRELKPSRLLAIHLLAIKEEAHIHIAIIHAIGQAQTVLAVQIKVAHH